MTRLVGLVAIGVLLAGIAGSAHAGVDPGANCKDKKGKAVGKATLDLLKAFGKNIKKKNLAKLGSDVSKAQSKLTKGFTKAEYTGAGALRGCVTTNDVGIMEAKVEMIVLETIGSASPACGDNIQAPGEDCDGTDDAGCPGLCNPDCTCPECGNLVTDGTEDCDTGITPGDCCVDAGQPNECTFVTSGTGCGSGADTDCTNPDTCDGAGTCNANHETSGTACGDPSDTDCTDPDTCNGSGTCLDNHATSGAACGNPADTECTDPDTCNGSGTCQPNHATGGAPCGDQGIECLVNDTCDGGGSCTDNGFSTSGTPCGSGANTECTDPDTCNGSGTCQPNHATGGAPCGDQGIDCRVDDTCDGGGSCTDNGFETGGTPCGDPSDTDCTDPDTCNGSGTCLANHATSGAACGNPADTECTDPDTCNGSGTCQPNHATGGAPCGDQGVECLADDTCDGSGGCTDNGFSTSGTPCDDGDPCTNPDECNGSGSCTPGGPIQLEFTTSTGVGDCGDITNTSGGGGTSLTPYGEGSTGLTCGSLYIGGGASVQPPSPVPANATSIFKITDCSSATAYVLAPTTAGDTGSSRTCTSPGCTFGPPLPIPNPGVPAISTCVINSIAASPAAGGVLDSTTGASTQTLPLSVLVHVSGDLELTPGIQPCPTCSGTCNSGPNSGSACTTTWSGGTTHDCPPPSATSLPTFGVDLSPLTTATSALDHASGGFCVGTTGQRSNGCFGNATCRHIEQTGSAGGAISAGSGLVATTLGSVFCIPSSGNMLVDTVADLPGPGSTSLPGNAEIP
jgi:hypothetical protein